MARGGHIRPACTAGLLGLAILLYGSPMGLPVADGDEVSTILALPVKSAVARPNPGLEDAVLGWLNRARTNQHLAPLRGSVMIQNVARTYGVEMFAHGYLSHVSRDGRTLQDRFAAGGLQPPLVGENLAYAGTIQDAEQALWRSGSHRHNILYPAFRSVGVAVIDGGREGLIVVQDFSDDQAAQGNLAREKTGMVMRSALGAPVVIPADPWH